MKKMKTWMSLLTTAATLAFMSVVCSGCDLKNNGSGPDDPSDATGITLSATEMTLMVNETKQLTAVLNAEAKVKFVTWSSDNERVATVMPDGTVAGVAEGNARHNAELNGLTPPCSFYAGILEELALDTASFDCLLANIHRNIILHDLPRYKTLLSPGGLLFVSGFYAGEDEEIITSTLERMGFALRARKESGEWVALSFASLSN